ncbi:MAG TPA: TolC family protein [Candidatus Alistipes pullicola]|nr:TolC family protein [Candidatus Alistipes pullicola]
MKQIAITLLCAASIATSGYAQRSIDEILRQIESASPEMQAQRELTSALKTEAKTGKYLSNPTVEMENLWGGAERAYNAELTVAQAFDFPTAYASRNKIARMQSSLYDNQQAAFRQQFLLDAELLCIDIIHLTRLDELYRQRLDRAVQMNDVYRKKMESGGANMMEYNKTNIELIDAQTQFDMNTAELQAKRRQLGTLTGNPDDTFADLQYPSRETLSPFEQISQGYLDGNPQIESLKNEVDINQRTVTLNRALSLPQFEVGYRHNFGVEGRYKGFLVGLSVPLFERKNTVKAAKARVSSSNVQLESTRRNLTSEVRRLYDQTLSLQRSIDATRELISNLKALETLDKALDAGQINIIDYLTESAVILQSKERLYQLERDYQAAAAQLFRYEL